MRIVAQIAAAFLLVAIVSALWRVTPFEVVAPDLGVVFALYLGLTASRSPLWEATAGAVAIGYVGDVLCGAPRGLGALVLGATCVLCRLLSGRLLVRGNLFVAGFTFAAALLATLGTVLVRLAFDAPLGLPANEALSALGSAAVTAILAPPTLRLCRSVDARFARTQREREALREGYLT
jgi:rod shape-determining protein MreD